MCFPRISAIRLLRSTGVNVSIRRSRSLKPEGWYLTLREINNLPSDRTKAKCTMTESHSQPKSSLLYRLNFY